MAVKGAARWAKMAYLLFAPLYILYLPVTATNMVMFH
jgi:hypothetical protein